jgi:hypothetical protein
VATFTNFSHNVATNITILFTSGSLTNTTSTAITVSPAVAAQLVFTTQPTNGVVGAALGTQPVLRARDQFGNNSAGGLGGGRSVTLTLSSGTGPLLGTTTLDIGTNAGNGVINCTDLRIDSAGTNKQLTASVAGLSDAVSAAFTVARGNQFITFAALTNKTYGDAAFALSATASSGLPVNFSIVSGPATVVSNTLTITGAGLVTVRASQAGDSNWSAATNVDQSFNVSASAPGSPANLTGIAVVANGIKITFTGSAGYTYHVERATTLQGASTVWESVGTVTLDSGGEGEFTDTQPPSDGAFYRAAWLFSP